MDFSHDVQIPFSDMILRPGAFVRKIFPSCWKSLIFLVAAVLLHAICFSAPSPGKTDTSDVQVYPIDSLNALMMKSMVEHKCTMVPDGSHGVGFFLNMVTGALQYWAEQLEKDPRSASLPHSICLLLEKDKAFEQSIKTFFDTGDIVPEFQREYAINTRVQINTFSIDYYAFLQSLRAVHEKIKILADKNPDLHIGLEVLGAEADPPYTLDEIGAMQQREFVQKRFNFFATVRDRESAANVRKALDEHPGSRALIFYGSAHLIRTKFDKGTMDNSTGQHVFDYFLAHFLDSLYGRDQNCVFQISPGRPNNEHDFAAQATFLLKSKIIPDAADYGIVIRDPVYWAIPYRFARSAALFGAYRKAFADFSAGRTDMNRRVFGAGVGSMVSDLMHSYYSADPVKRRSVDSLLAAGRLSVHDSSAIPEVLRISDALARDFDPVKNIDSMATWLLDQSQPDSMSYFKMLREVLCEFPHPRYDAAESWLDADERLAGQPSHPAYCLSEVEKTALHNALPELKRIALFSLGCIGTKEERDAAIRQLQMITGRSYGTIAEWAKWWPHRFDKK